MGEYIKVDQMNPDTSVVSLAVEVARRGGVLIMPTDSVYGVGAAATPQNPGHKRIFEIKQRPSTQTLPWLVGSKSDLQKYAHITHSWANKLVEVYWPGALTLVVTASENVLMSTSCQITEPLHFVCPTHLWYVRLHSSLDALWLLPAQTRTGLLLQLTDAALKQALLSRQT